MIETLLIGIIIIVIMGLFLINSYNKIKKDQLKVSEARSNIDIYLNQRYDEISSLYKVVQEFKLHETTLLKELVQLRQQALSSNLSFEETTKLHNKMEERIAPLLANFENYPELRSNENFLALQKAIEENEDNISASRKAYNSYTNTYNTTIAMIPLNILARMFGFKSETLYVTPETKRDNPLQ